LGKDFILKLNKLPEKVKKS